MFCRRGLCEYFYTNLHLLWHFVSNSQRLWLHSLLLWMTRLCNLIDLFSNCFGGFLHPSSVRWLVCIKKFWSSCRSPQPLHLLDLRPECLWVKGQARMKYNFTFTSLLQLEWKCNKLRITSVLPLFLYSLQLRDSNCNLQKRN